MESIRWLLTVAEVDVSEGCGGVSLNFYSCRNPKPLECALNLFCNLISQYDEVHLKTREQFEKLLSGELVSKKCFMLNVSFARSHITLVFLS